MREQGICYDKFKDHLKIMDFMGNFTKKCLDYWIRYKTE